MDGSDELLHSHLAFPPFVSPLAQQDEHVPARAVIPSATNNASTAAVAASASASTSTLTSATARPSRKRAATMADDPSSKAIKRDEGTGKRVERGRRLELGRALRTKMRMEMNIGQDDPLPTPTPTPPEGSDAEDGTGAWVPNWTAGLGDPANVQVSHRGGWGLTTLQWLDRLCLAFTSEARNYKGWEKVPPEDLEEEIVKVGVKIGFQPSSPARRLHARRS
jgi:hypothetical protein